MTKITDERLAEVGTTLNFFASVIKSGETWTATCQRDFDNAHAALSALRAQGGVRGGIAAIREYLDRPTEGPEHGAWDRGRRSGLRKAIEILSSLEASPAPVGEEMVDEPYENTFSIDELRKEVRRQWDARNALVKALKELPEVPDWRVLKLLSHAAVFPDDCNVGKMMQREHGFDVIAPRAEYEMGAGLWSRLRAALAAKGGH